MSRRGGNLVGNKGSHPRENRQPESADYSDRHPPDLCHPATTNSRTHPIVGKLLMKLNPSVRPENAAHGVLTRDFALYESASASYGSPRCRRRDAGLGRRR